MLKFALMVGLILLILLTSCTETQFPNGVFVRENRFAQYEFTENGQFVTWLNGIKENEGTFSINGNEFTWETDVVC